MSSSSDSDKCIVIHLKGPGKEPVRTTTPSLLPCTIDYSGEAKIATYFNIDKSTDNNDSNIRAAFRGRGLIGEHINLLDTSVGFIVEKSGRTTENTPSIQRTKNYLQKLQNDQQTTTTTTTNDENQLHWRSSLIFNDLIAYHRDGDILYNDGIKKSINEWPKLANVIHTPIPL